MIATIILAAGVSSRFGSNKLLQHLGEEPIIRRVVKATSLSESDRIVVVTGFEAEKVAAALSGIKVEVVENPDYDRGQSSSVKAGLELVKDQAEAVLILPGDVALISTASIDLVIDRYRKERGRIVVAAHKDRMGHPILIARSLFNEVMEIDEATQGLKHIIHKYSGEIKMVEVGTDEVLFDIDTKQDYNYAASRAELK